MSGDGPEDDPRSPLDPLLDTPRREGLTGTAPADRYKPVADPELVTTPPDGRPMELQPAWRTDFPVDWPQDHYVERRDFMKFMILTSLAFAVGQAWIAAMSWLRRRRDRHPELRIARIDEVPVGGAIEFAYPEPHDACVLVRPREDLLIAYSQRCTHLSCAVRPQVDRGVFHCPCHEGRFDMETGRPLAGPPRRALSRIVLANRGGAIYAVGVEERTI
ncbi:MAG TPA: Rieske 2Fe-2S domain-containing protein [Candidatus Polarisedimenticolia bacterium]|nr:Rieske 2Fe-2S domain-containing protein [Candidatus Polarisedimenticolia bacterium]